MKTGLCVIVAAVIAALMLADGCAQSRRRTITIEEGRQLVYQSLRAEGFTRLALTVDGYEVADRPGFHFYDVRYGFNPYASSRVGAYAVEETTGEVWDGVVCAHYTSSVLEKMQKDLRRRIGLTDEERRRIQKPGPFCGNNRKDTLEPMPKAWKE